MTGKYTITLTGVGPYHNPTNPIHDPDRLLGSIVKRLHDNGHEIESATFEHDGKVEDAKLSAGVGSSQLPTPMPPPIAPTSPSPVMGGTLVEPPPSEAEAWTLLVRTADALGMPAGNTPQGVRVWTLRDLPEWAGMSAEQRRAVRLDNGLT